MLLARIDNKLGEWNGMGCAVGRSACRSVLFCFILRGVYASCRLITGYGIPFREIIAVVLSEAEK